MVLRDYYSDSPRVLALVSAKDEEEGIANTLEELSKVLPNIKILVVDGHSQDKTVEIAKDFNADVAVQPGYGKGDAVAHGLRLLNGDWDYVILTDADFTYPAEYIPQMIEVLEKKPSVGMMCGNRFNSHFHLKGMNNVFYLGNRLLAFSHNMLNGVTLRDPLTGLRVVRAEILKGWKPKSVGFDIEVELNHHVERRGYGIEEIPIPYRTRLGRKKLKITSAFEIIKRMLLETTY